MGNIKSRLTSAGDGSAGRVLLLLTVDGQVQESHSQRYTLQYRKDFKSFFKRSDKNWSTYNITQIRDLTEPNDESICLFEIEIEAKFPLPRKFILKLDADPIEIKFELQRVGQPLKIKLQALQSPVTLNPSFHDFLRQTHSKSQLESLPSSKYLALERIQKLSRRLQEITSSHEMDSQQETSPSHKPESVKDGDNHITDPIESVHFGGSIHSPSKASSTESKKARKEAERETKRQIKEGKKAERRLAQEEGLETGTAIDGLFFNPAPATKIKIKTTPSIEKRPETPPVLLSTEASETQLDPNMPLPNGWTMAEFCNTIIKHNIIIPDEEEYVRREAEAFNERMEAEARANPVDEEQALIERLEKARANEYRLRQYDWANDRFMDEARVGAVAEEEKKEQGGRSSEVAESLEEVDLGSPFRVSMIEGAEAGQEEAARQAAANQEAANQNTERRWVRVPFGTYRDTDMTMSEKVAAKKARKLGERWPPVA